jgi:hypothetical protein
VGPTDHSAGLRGGVESTFSREQCIRPTLLTTHERLPHTGLAWEAYVSCWSGFPLQGVH